MTKRSQAPGVSWARFKATVSGEQHDQLMRLATSSGLSAAQHIRLAVLAYLSEEESAWTAEAATLARQGHLARAFEDERRLAVALSPEHKVRLLERAQSSGLPVTTHLRLALIRYLAPASENAPAS